MQRILICFFIVFTIVSKKTGFAQSSLSMEGSRAAAMGGIQSPMKDVYSAFGNQAGLAHIDQITIGAFFENRFAVQKLSRSGLTAAFPTKFGTFAFAGSFYGYSMYNETLLGLAYGRSLVPQYLSIGMKMNYYQLQLGDDFGSKHTVTAEVGLMSSPIDGLTIGLHFDNPIPQSISEYPEENLPSRIKFGAAYRFEKIVLLALEADKQLDQEETNLKAGLEFEFLKRFYLRTGISSYPAQFSFGLGFKWTDFRADIAFLRHETLGYSPKFGLSYAL